jgi:hypothetical protein
MEVQELIRDFFENLHSNKFENLKEMDRFLDTYDHPKLNQEEINHLPWSHPSTSDTTTIHSISENISFS